MALSLSAEQKFILDIFSGKSKYIIPHYQRAYSWDTEQCSELLDDIFRAFEEDEEEGYFLGNIVIARNTKERNNLEVIDGQQRLLTLTLLIKILFDKNPDDTDLEKALKIPSKIRGEEGEQRVLTKVFEEKDAKNLKLVLDTPTDNLCSLTKDNNFSKNACFMKNKLEETFTDTSKNTLGDFSEFLMEKTSLLPIETTDEDKDIARQKALKIFETINNRGKDLSSSDIFKARLYSIALNIDESDTFISRWDKFTKECEDFKDKNYSVDRIFKIYSFILRAKDSSTDSEVGLMSFFSLPFFKERTYSEVMDDLLQITASVEFYKKNIVNSTDPSLMKWFQLINEYTNNYPKDTLILYIFKNKSFEDYNSSLIDFTKNLVKYSYYRGSTTYIKHEMYKLMIEVIKIPDYKYSVKINNIGVDDLYFFGRLYKGFGLLNIYLDEATIPTYPYYIKRLRDMTKYKYPQYSYYDKIGHTIVLDSDKKAYESINFEDFDEQSYNMRREELRTKLISFFQSDLG